MVAVRFSALIDRRESTEALLIFISVGAQVSLRRQVLAHVRGFAGHPLGDGKKLICLAGGDGSVAVAFDKDTGQELWRAQTAGTRSPIFSLAKTSRVAHGNETSELPMRLRD